MSSFNSFSPANYGYHRRSSSGSSAGEPTMADHYAHEQSVIPPVLLENYLSMAEPSKAQSVDSDIARHCAFSFPAVAFTLGKENWKCLKELYEALASDVQWKVRRTLAFSIHDVAVILGREATERDLMPIFDGFLKDLDEVKIGVLKHLADFLKLMDLKLRKTYLPRFRDFLETDNTRNWRFRYDLAEQMILLVDLFEPEDVSEYLVPLGITLLSDRVSEVRLITYNFVSKVVKHLQGDSYRKLRLMVVNDLIAKFARSGRWLHRQMFIHICGVLLDDGALSPDQFAKDLLPSVFALASDPVPNVRMAVSKLLFVNLVKHDFFTTSSNPHHTELAAACTVLRGDSDRDVRFYGCPPMHVSASVETVFDGSAECLTDVIRDVSPSREASIPIGQVD